jgi:hypothetical protein
MPFSTSDEEWPSNVVLRLSGESPSWYEVEVNENTRATKFVLKKDPMWAKVTWYHWFVHDTRIYIDNERTKLYDKPNGDIIEDTANYNFTTLNVMKVDGDWALARGFIGVKQYLGWIRWRQGRKLLVGCIFNNSKIP